MDELALFIDKVYREPYSVLSNNCIHKSLKIKAKAGEIGKRADLIGCISLVPKKRWYHFPPVNVHVYVEVDGKKVDVSLDPGNEAKYFKNGEKRLIMPVNISRPGRMFKRGNRHQFVSKDLEVTASGK